MVGISQDITPEDIIAERKISHAQTNDVIRPEWHLTKVDKLFQMLKKDDLKNLSIN
jgi:radical SAM superfamily enzyme